MDEKQYYLGLDIGTDSVGWALLDDEHRLVKKNGFTLWGVRMFDEAKAAKERRGYRSQRRRLRRRKERIGYLRDVFAPEIYKVDPTFFEKLDDSFYYQEDKRNKNYYNLFNGTYTDQQFFAEYPTMYHLRQALLKSDEKMDIRFIYLAFHHMIKYRGNFLHAGDVFNNSDDSEVLVTFDAINDALDLLDEEHREDEDYNEDYFAKLKIEDDEKFLLSLREILINKYSLNDRKNKMKDLFGTPKKSIYTELIIPLIAGSSVSVQSAVSFVKPYKYEECKISLDTDDINALGEGCKTKIPELSPIFDLLEQIKGVSDHFFVVKLLNNETYLSDALVKKYNEHQIDLKRLKVLLKKYRGSEEDKSDDLYYQMFRKIDEKTNNYVHYVGMNSTGGNMTRFSHCTRDEFYKYLDKILQLVDKEEDQEEKKYFLDKKANNDLFLRQNSNQNGTLPKQLNQKEIRDIIKKQGIYYPFLMKKCDDGEYVIEKIFNYKIPYYIGPLNTNSKFAWVKKNSNEKVTPFNFDKVINFDDSAKEFIQRMQNKCTYLKGDDDYCLPKNSLLFSEYNCLSYLNKIKINGSYIPYDIKMGIFNEVFLKIKKPSKKDILEYLKVNYGLEEKYNCPISEAVTTAKKELPDVNCDMASYIFFKNLFNDEFEARKDDIERIILDATIFEDKDQLAKRLQDIYHLDDEKIKKIKSLSYKKYGRLSRRLLDGITCGENHLTVIQIMRKTSLNLQEILFSKEYKLNDEIDKYNKEFLNDEDESLEDFIDENISVSPILKRPLIQSYRIIEEVEKITHHKIDKFFVECTRTNKADKKKTKSRYEIVKELYDECKKISSELNNVDLKHLSSLLEENKDALRSDAIYLYFMQLGKSMYTLENIDFSLLSKEYDIDHIYPQSLIKDDSITNRVLVEKTFNNAKSDKFLFEISDNLNPHRYGFYRKLLDLKMISNEKYNRLTEKEVSSEKLEGFVNRQLVITNQAVKGLIQVLKLYKGGVNDTDVIYSKAENVTSFRQLYDLTKSRTANNFHHAHDAYLNVIVGDILNKYYTDRGVYYFKDYERMKNDGKSINPEKILKLNYVNAFGKCVWNKEIDLKNIYYDLYDRHDVHETIRTYNSNTMYTATTILPASNGNLVPAKMNSCLRDTSKYGGITSNSYCKYVIVENIGKKKNKEYILEAIPKRYENNIDEYLSSIGYTHFCILHNNIQTNVIIEEEARRFVITGKTNAQFVLKNFNDRIFSKEDIAIIKKIDKYNDNVKEKREMKLKSINDIETYEIFAPGIGKKVISHDNGESEEVKYVIKGEYLNRLEVMKVLSSIVEMYHKSIYGYSNIVNISNKLESFDFSTLDLNGLIKVVSELLILLKTNERGTADLTLIGESKKSGTLTHSNKFTKGTKFIAYSITGYYKKVLFEVPD